MFKVTQVALNKVITKKVNLGEISLKIMSGQDLANAGQTEGPTNNMPHNIKRPKGRIHVTIILHNQVIHW